LEVYQFPFILKRKNLHKIFMSDIKTNTNDLQFDDSSKFQIAAVEKIKRYNPFAKDDEEYANLGFFERLNEQIIDMSPVGIKDKVIFYRLLATMINAGVSLVKSLQILGDQFENPKMQKLCRKIQRDLEEGFSLGDALKKFSDTFETAELGMISAGEVSGRLNTVLLTLADKVEESSKIRGKIKGAMMYPMAIIIVICIVLAAVLILVIPGMKDTFEKGGAELPGSTKLLITMSDGLVGSTLGIPNAILVILSVVAFVVGVKVWKKTKEGKYHWDNLMLHLPVFGTMNRKMVLMQFCQSLSNLSSSGVSITKSLEITSNTVGNEVYRRRILYIKEDVQQGIPIADNIRENKKMFPVMLTAMIEVGEKTAELGKICNKVAEFYKEEVETMVKTLSSLMEPIIIVVIGGVVGFIVAAIMQPIMMMSEVAAGAS
jgi:type IV pilus assembly protein PilC